MTVIDKVNLGLTIISIFATLVSIGFSIWSFQSAKKAKQYKSDIINFKDTLDLKGFQSVFEMESNRYLMKTGEKNWYKGRDSNQVIAPFVQILLSFGKVKYIQNSDILQQKVRKLQELIQFDSTNLEKKRDINSLIFDINKILQNLVNDNISKVD